ncbi:MAG: DedA family protein [Thermoprotei archaeon]
MRRKRSTSGNDESYTSKYLHYAFVISILALVVSAVGIFNGYLRAIDVSAYISEQKKSLSFLSSTGYVGMFFIFDFSTIPVYVLVPFYGYLCYIGDFSLRLTFITMTASALFLDEVEYLSGRFVARSILRRVLAHFKVGQKQLEKAQIWIERHGPFSVFMSAFFLELGDATSLAAGTLKMNVVKYTAASLAGDASQIALLLYLGYAGLNVLKPSLDYAYRYWFMLAMLCSIGYIVAYMKLIRKNQSRRLVDFSEKRNLKIFVRFLRIGKIRFSFG